MKKAILKRYYPIEGRTDFFKYVILIDGVKQKDFEGKDMYFDVFRLDQAVKTCEAINKVKGYDTSFQVVESFALLQENDFYNWLTEQGKELTHFIEAIKLYTGILQPFVGREDGTAHRYVFNHYWRNVLDSKYVTI